MKGISVLFQVVQCMFWLSLTTRQQLPWKVCYTLWPHLIVAPLLGHAFWSISTLYNIKYLVTSILEVKWNGNEVSISNKHKFQRAFLGPWYKFIMGPHRALDCQGLRVQRPFLFETLNEEFMQMWVFYTFNKVLWASFVKTITLLRSLSQLVTQFVRSLWQSKVTFLLGQKYLFSRS